MVEPLKVTVKAVDTYDYKEATEIICHNKRGSIRSKVFIIARTKDPLGNTYTLDLTNAFNNELKLYKKQLDEDIAIGICNILKGKNLYLNDRLTITEPELKSFIPRKFMSK